jgi:hypothetical protein
MELRSCGFDELLVEVKAEPTTAVAAAVVERILVRGGFDTLACTSTEFLERLEPLSKEEKIAAQKVYFWFLADDCFELGLEKRKIETIDENGKLWLDRFVSPARRSIQPTKRRWEWDELLAVNLGQAQNATCVSFCACSLSTDDMRPLELFLGVFNHLREIDLSSNTLRPSDPAVCALIRDLLSRNIRCVLRFTPFSHESDAKIFIASLSSHDRDLLQILD